MRHSSVHPPFYSFIPPLARKREWQHYWFASFFFSPLHWLSSAIHPTLSHSKCILSLMHPHIFPHNGCVWARNNLADENNEELFGEEQKKKERKKTTSRQQRNIKCFYLFWYLSRFRMCFSKFYLQWCSILLNTEETVSLKFQGFFSSQGRFFSSVAEPLAIFCVFHTILTFY